MTETEITVPDDLLDRAFRRFRRDCEAVGAAPAQPACYSYVEEDTAVLLNIHGELARYRWDGRRLVEAEVD
jgi:hypothetical protein